MAVLWDCTQDEPNNCLLLFAFIRICGLAVSLIFLFQGPASNGYDSRNMEPGQLRQTFHPLDVATTGNGLLSLLSLLLSLLCFLCL